MLDTLSGKYCMAYLYTYARRVHEQELAELLEQVKQAEASSILRAAQVSLLPPT